MPMFEHESFFSLRNSGDTEGGKLNDPKRAPVTKERPPKKPKATTTQTKTK